MSYLLTQLWLSLLIAAIIGGVLGWIMRGGCKKFKVDIRNLESKFYKLEREYTSIKKKAQKLKSIVRERNILLSRFEKVDDQKKIQHEKLLKIRSLVKKALVSREKMAAKLKKVQEVLTFAKQAQQAKDASIEQIKKESSATEHLLMRCQEDWDSKHRLLRSQRDVSLLNQKAAEEKMSLAVVKLKEAKESLKAVKINLASTQNKLKSAKETESIRVEQEAAFNAKEAAFNAKIEELTSYLEKEKKKLQDVSGQFKTFKAEAKHYVSSVAEENKNYIGVVDRLEEDIEEGRLAVKEKDEKLDAINAELASNKKEMTALKRQLQAQAALSSVSSSYSNAKLKPSTELENKMALRHVDSMDTGLANRWRKIKKSRFRRRPR